jgi:hypothetical protein
VGEQPVTQAALKSIEELTRFIATEDPHKVRRGSFTYNRELEVKRIDRAKAIIRRTDPGPFEDPNYISLLAYQAASIEMAFDEITMHVADSAYFSRFLLGTIAAPDIDAFALKEFSEGYGILVFYSGLIDFIYQASKVIVEALEPSRATNGHSLVSANFNLDDLRNRLNLNLKPADRLYKTLEAYFFHGYPRASAYEIVPEEHSPVLSIVVRLAERWVIGHEYGHILMPTIKQIPDSVNAFNVEEYFADKMATLATVLSAFELDKIAPEIILGGAIFALACLDILQRAYNILTFGDEFGSNTEEMTLVKPEERAQNIIIYFNQFFDVEYLPDGGIRLSFILRQEVPQNHNFPNERIKHAYKYAKVLLIVWEQVKLRFMEDYNQKRPIHPSWNK